MEKAPILEVWVGDHCMRFDPKATIASPPKWETGNDCIDLILNEGLFKPLLDDAALPQIRAHWRTQLMAAIQNPPNTPELSTAFHTQWHVCHHFLRELVDDDDLLFDLTRVWLPKYGGLDLVLYRGENTDRFLAGKLGSAWSTKQETAEVFARGLNAVGQGGTLLRAMVPASLIIAGPSTHSLNVLCESEFTVDTRQLTGVVTVATFPPSH